MSEITGASDSARRSNAASRPIGRVLPGGRQTFDPAIKQRCLELARRGSLEPMSRDSDPGAHGRAERSELLIHVTRMTGTRGRHYRLELFVLIGTSTLASRGA